LFPKARKLLAAGLAQFADQVPVPAWCSNQLSAQGVWAAALCWRTPSDGSLYGGSQGTLFRRYCSRWTLRSIVAVAHCWAAGNSSTEMASFCSVIQAA